MTVLTIRRTSDHVLLAFGPADGQYDPAYDADTMTKQVEPDDAAILVEWQAIVPAPNARVSAKAALRASKNLPDLITALEALL